MAQQPKKEEQQPFRKKEGAFVSLLLSLAKLLPGSVVNAFGGPVVAGLAVAVTGAVAVGVPAIYLGAKAAGLKPPQIVAKSSGSAFSKAFGDQKSVGESVLGADAYRQLSSENEEEHSDEDTSLGYLIPEKSPESEKADKDEQGDKGKDKAYKTADGKDVDAKIAKDLKGRFAPKAEGGAGGASLSGIGGGGGGGSQAMAGGAGAQPSLGSSAGGLSAAGGNLARGAKAAVKGGKLKIGTKKTGALSGLRGAAQLTQKGYGVDQHASGYQGAAFGEAPKSAAIVGGGPAASVGGASLRDGGLADTPPPDKLGQGGEVKVGADKCKANPEAQGCEPEKESGPFPAWGALLIALAGTVGLALLLNQTAILKLARDPKTQWAAYLLAAGVVAALATVFGLLVAALLCQGPFDVPSCTPDKTRTGVVLGIAAGVIAAVTALMFYTAATGNNWIGDSKEEFLKNAAKEARVKDIADAKELLKQGRTRDDLLAMDDKNGNARFSGEEIDEASKKSTKELQEENEYLKAKTDNEKLKNPNKPAASGGNSGSGSEGSGTQGEKNTGQSQETPKSKADQQAEQALKNSDPKGWNEANKPPEKTPWEKMHDNKGASSQAPQTPAPEAPSAPGADSPSAPANQEGVKVTNASGKVEEGPGVTVGSKDPAPSAADAQAQELAEGLNQNADKNYEAVSGTKSSTPAPPSGQPSKVFEIPNQISYMKDGQMYSPSDPGYDAEYAQQLAKEKGL